MTVEETGAHRSASRRLLLQSAAGGAALVAIGGAVRLGQRGPDSPGSSGSAGSPEAAPREALTLATGAAGEDVDSLTFRLTPEEMHSLGPDHWETDRLPTSTHSMIGFTWGLDEQPPQLQVRSRHQGTWGEWQSVGVMDDLVDPTEVPADAGGRAGADLTWVGDADGVQVRVGGSRPADLAMVLLHPQPRESDDAPDLAPEVAAATESDIEPGPEGPEDTDGLDGTVPGASFAPASWGDPEDGYEDFDAAFRTVGAAAVLAPTARGIAPSLRPPMVPRRRWGAQPALRSGEPRIDAGLDQVHIHHTVNSNTYRRADVPALIRGMYAYHTQSLGWSDIGYNFLVDRFGRIFVGRAGGPRRPVRGSHTLGFNDRSTGIAAIGNYEIAEPSPELITALARLSAWKLARAGRRPRQRLYVTSRGSNRFRAGLTVRLPVIDGHRDTNRTACPGRYLYARLPRVRRRAGRMLRRATAAAA